MNSHQQGVEQAPHKVMNDDPKTTREDINNNDTQYKRTRRPLSSQEFQAATDAVEQEMNVVTALKRLSIGNSLNYDPDLPYLTNEEDVHDSLTLSESTSPTKSSPNTSDFSDSTSEGVSIDTEKLLWVPANAHPEIAPEKFKQHIQQTVLELTDKLNNKNSLHRSSSLSNSSRPPETTSSTYQEDPQLQKKQPSIKALTRELEKLSEMAGMPINDAASLARTLSTSSLGYTQSEKEAFNGTPGLEDQASTLKRSRYMTYRRGSVRDSVQRRKSRDHTGSQTASKDSHTPVQHPYHAIGQQAPSQYQPQDQQQSSQYQPQNSLHRPQQSAQPLKRAQPPLQRRPSGEPYPLSSQHSHSQQDFAVQSKHERRHHKKRYPQQYMSHHHQEQQQQQQQQQPPPLPPKNDQIYPGPQQPIPGPQSRHHQRRDNTSLAQKPQPLLPHQIQHQQQQQQQQRSHHQQYQHQHQQQPQQPALRTLRPSNMDMRQSRAGAPPTQMAPSPQPVPENLENPSKQLPEIKHLSINTSENQENVHPSSVTVSPEPKSDEEVSPSTETRKSSKKGWQWLKEKSSDKNLSKSYQRDKEKDEAEAEIHRVNDSVNHSRNRHGSFVTLTPDASRSNESESKEKDAKNILSSLFKKKDKKSHKQQDNHEVKGEPTATQATNHLTPTPTPRATATPTPITQSQSKPVHEASEVEEIEIRSSSSSPKAQSVKEDDEGEEEGEEEEEEEEVVINPSQRDESESFKSTLKIEPRQSKPNQPIQYTDSAFGFPLPPASHSTLVMLDYRFPIHVERAIYRLSHLKLANPKRPLRQQVLLSNFMYAYLNLVNHSLYLQQQMSEPEVEMGKDDLQEEILNKDPDEKVIQRKLDDRMMNQNSHNERHEIYL